MSWIKKAAEFPEPRGPGWDYPKESYAEKAESSIKGDAATLVKDAQNAGLTPREGMLALMLGKGAIDSSQSTESIWLEFEEYFDAESTLTWDDVETEAFDYIWNVADNYEDHLYAVSTLENGLGKVLDLKGAK